ncbi:hypothetical protein trd_0208 [Thermomicrobium roseum DSM 5159]|uniref:Uncharacterized protein n=1 Tax=Thermomicrobium roseum (strain ATCC 27502 / DSM 5159 / P-2) TaxID=309801 RepID=B9KXM1_THERP|nr:hypothetical protein trd_0208 [Thermomicrobium roseum DSM 5159]
MLRHPVPPSLLTRVWRSIALASIRQRPLRAAAGRQDEPSTVGRVPYQGCGTRSAG